MVPAAETPCERCGTFAPLTSNGFRAWCAACWALPPGPLERPLDSPVAVGVTTVGVLWRHAPLFLAVQALRMVPSFALTHLWPGHPGAGFALSAVLGTFVECLVLGRVVELELGQRPGWRAVWQRLRRRYAAVLVVNVVANLAMFAGMVMLLLPTFVIANFLNLAVPLALFDALPPWRALAQSVVRSWRVLWRHLGRPRGVDALRAGGQRGAQAARARDGRRSHRPRLGVDHVAARLVVRARRVAGVPAVRRARVTCLRGARPLPSGARETRCACSSRRRAPRCSTASPPRRRSGSAGCSRARA